MYHSFYSTIIPVGGDELLETIVIVGAYECSSRDGIAITDQLYVEY